MRHPPSERRRIFGYRTPEAPRRSTPAPRRLGGCSRGRRRLVPDVLQQGESDAAQLGEPIADEGLRLAQLLRLRRRGGPLGYGGKTGPALLVATPYGLEAGGARLGFWRLVATVVGAAI